MTATSHTNPTLAEIAAVHEAAAALGRPSRVYRAGGLLTADQWAGHVKATLRSHAEWRLSRLCAEMMRTAEIYGTAAQVIDTREVRR